MVKISPVISGTVNINKYNPQKSSTKLVNSHFVNSGRVLKPKSSDLEEHVNMLWGQTVWHCGSHHWIEVGSTFIFRAYFIIGKTFRNFMGIPGIKVSIMYHFLGFRATLLIKDEAPLVCKSPLNPQDSASKEGEHEVHC